MNKIAVIVVPHPDDFEILVCHPAQYLLNYGFKVYEILFTGGEYGLVNRGLKKMAHLKGKPLQKIREKENIRSKSHYGIDENGNNLVNTIKMGFIDGFTPTNVKSVNLLFEVFEKIQPNIIIGPDPVFSIDWHNDHMAVAYNCYFAAKKYSKNHPNSFLGYLTFQSFKPNFTIPEQSWDVFENATLEHYSQMTPFLTKIIRHFLKNIFYKLKRHRIGLRKITFSSFDQISTFKEKILYVLFSRKTPAIPDKSLYSPPPEDIGLERYPYQ